jgi:hypothetical protein
LLAIEARGDSLERVMAERVIVPRLSQILELLDLRTDSIDEIREALRKAEYVRDIVDDVRKGINRARMPLLYNVLANAVVRIGEIVLMYAARAT